MKINELMQAIQGQEGVVLMNGGGDMTVQEVDKLRQITMKLIWTGYPTMYIEFMNPDCDMTEKFYKPDEGLY